MYATVPRVHSGAPSQLGVVTGGSLQVTSDVDTAAGAGTRVTDVRAVNGLI